MTKGQLISEAIFLKNPNAIFEFFCPTYLLTRAEVFRSFLGRIEIKISKSILKLPDLYSYEALHSFILTVSLLKVYDKMNNKGQIIY